MAIVLADEEELPAGVLLHLDPGRHHDPRYNLYSLSDGDVVKAHKVVRVRMADGRPEEIARFPDTIISKTLMQKTKLTRYYFLSDDERDEAERKMKGR